MILGITTATGINRPHGGCRPGRTGSENREAMCKGNSGLGPEMLVLAEPGKRHKGSMGKAKIPTTRPDLVPGPIVVTTRGLVLDGYARLAAARECGVDEVPAIVVKHPDIRGRQREVC
jgi:hypothetical protein